MVATALHHRVVGQPHTLGDGTSIRKLSPVLWEKAVTNRYVPTMNATSLSAEDYDADLAERYGWINRALPAGELDDFVKSLAHRIAGFPVRAKRRTPHRQADWNN
jgi:enoyl-CoA hydratase/carnithine racemase